MSFDLHAIQLQSIRVQELHLEIFDLAAADDPEEEFSFSFKTGHAEFVELDDSIVVGVRGAVGEEEDGSVSGPYLIRAHLVGKFHIDTTKFPVKMIEKWAKENAPLILLPFLREHIYGLALRAGIKDLVVPLYILPSVKIESPK